MDYHNLQAILDGRVSGHFCEWPLIRPELRYLFDELSRYKAAWRDIKDRVKYMDLDLAEINLVEKIHGIGGAGEG